MSAINASLSDATLSILAAQKFSEQCMSLDSAAFYESLDDRVVMTFARVKGGFCDPDPERIEGKDLVFQSYKENFFDISRGSDWSRVSYQGFGLNATVETESNEKKEDPNGEVSEYHMVCKIHFSFKREGDVMKITEIYSQNTKDRLE